MRRQVMARNSLQDIATRLLMLLSPDTRLDELRVCKNEIIGHEEKKSLWVRGGLLKYLTEILILHTGQPGSTPKRHQGRSEQEEARLQAIIVVGSIAQGQYSTGFTRLVPPLRDRTCFSADWRFPLRADVAQLRCQSADLICCAPPRWIIARLVDPSLMSYTHLVGRRHEHVVARLENEMIAQMSLHTINSHALSQNGLP